MSMEKGRPAVLDELADSRHLYLMLLGLINISGFGIFMYVMSWYSRGSVMFKAYLLSNQEVVGSKPG